MHQFRMPATAKAIPSVSKLRDIASFYNEQFDMSSAETRLSIATKLGKSNLLHSKIPSPSSDRVQDMLITLCGSRCPSILWKVTDTAPHSRLEDEQWHLYLGFVLWITCLITGLGSEVLIYVFYLWNNQWNEEYERKWALAQFVFPVLLATTLGLAASQNFLVLPILVMGLWKFGFPETILYQHVALFGCGDDDSFLGRISDFLNGSGTAVHHGATALGICMIVAGVITPDRWIMDPCLVLVMQHWFVLLRHVNHLGYIFIELFFEAWFEWLVITSLQHYIADHWTVALTAATMLVAHWQYLLAAGLDLVRPSAAEKPQEVSKRRL
jgi:hypothetical protein